MSQLLNLILASGFFIQNRIGIDHLLQESQRRRLGCVGLSGLARSMIRKPGPSTPAEDISARRA